MTYWQRRARLVIAIGAVAFAVVVAFALKRRDPVQTPAAPVRDSGAVVEVTEGRVERFKFSRQDVRVEYQRQLTFADGSTKLMDVTIAADERDPERGGRRFTVTGAEARVGQNESTLQLDGKVQLTGSDGLTVRAEHASYLDKEGIVQSPGPVEFAQGRMAGSGIGMKYDTVRDVLTILDRGIVQVAADEKGAGDAEIAARSVVFSRREKNVRFEGAVNLRRGGQTMNADAATALLTADEKQIQKLELRSSSRIAMDKPAPGNLAALTGRDIDLKYGADGLTLEQANLVGEGAILLAGSSDAAGRQISADTIDVVLAPDGTTPVTLVARDSVVLTLPPERGPQRAGNASERGQAGPQRTIEASAMDANGEAGRGLTRAQFRGNVRYREQGSGAGAISREATAATLDVVLKPGMAGIQDAKFLRGVHFVDGAMTSDAAETRYDLDKGILELTGTEPRMLRPRVVNDQLAVDATRIDVTLDGPHLKAMGAVKSVVRPEGESRAAGARTPSQTRVPSMFRQDRPVNVTANQLEYNGASRKATYTGNTQLWQEETSLKAATIVLDDKTGDLTAAGGVTTVTVRDVVNRDKKTERVRSIATSTDFRYEETGRRATYTGDAHMNSSDGDVTATRIELYLKPSAGASGGSELERAEAYENVTLRDQNRTTTGDRLTYTTGDQRYVVTGTPVKVIDECRRETIGKTLTYLKSAETVTIDGNEQTRTQTKGSGQCP